MDYNNHMKNPSLATLGAGLALGVLFDIFIHVDFIGVAAPLFIVLVIVAHLALLAYFKHSITRQTLFTQAPLLFFSFMIFVRDSPSLILLDIAACAFFFTLSVLTTAGTDLKSLLPSDYLRFIKLPLRFTKAFFVSLSDLFDSLIRTTNRDVIKQIIKGVFITLPVLIVFTMLLASADQVFNKYMTSIMTLNVSDEVIVRTIEIVIMTILFAGAFSVALTKPAVISSNDKTIPPKISQLEALILFGSVELLFALFIILQIAYLFGGQNTIASQGFTYADYARRGFFELLVVACLSFGMTWLAERYLDRPEKGHSRRFKYLSSILVIETMLIIASSFKRLWLYEEAYGFTNLRLFSHLFVVMIAVLFAALLYKIIRNQSDGRFTFASLLIATGFLALLNLINPDQLIAQQNLGRLSKTGKIDVQYLNGLSDDAVPTLTNALPLSDKATSKQLAISLLSRLQTDVVSTHKQWQAYNLSRTAASVSLKNNENKLLKLAR